MATTSAPITNGIHHPDWDDRYYHIDQVLDRPGPRTDPDSFMAGDGVSDLAPILLSTALYAPFVHRLKPFYEINAKSSSLARVVWDVRSLRTWLYQDSKIYM
jgi:hypothetical protein